MYEFRTLELVVEFAKECQRIRVPQYMETQFLKASSSIPMNLAEGAAKASTPDRFRFYRIALGSFRETVVILTLLEEEHLKKKSEKLGAHLVKLVKSQK